MATLPVQAGPIVFHMRRIRPLRIVLAVAAIGLLVGFGVAERKYLPVVGGIAGFCVVIGGGGALVRYLAVTTLYALCEHGAVTRKGSAFTFVPWSEIRGLTKTAYRGHINYAIQTTGKPLLFYPGALGN